MSNDTGQMTDGDQQTEEYVHSYVTTKGFFPFMSTYHLWPVAAIVAADAVVNVIMIVRKRNRNREKSVKKAVV